MKEKNIKEKTQQKKKMGLTTKIFVALIAGAILGIILCYLVPDSSFKKDVIVEGILYVIGQGFIRLMKMLVVPLVFCSLVCGSMSIGAWNRRCENTGILSGDYSSGCFGCSDGR